MSDKSKSPRASKKFEIKEVDEEKEVVEPEEALGE